ncbi:MAG TPA: glycerophosphodiester phosphodiesterase family protein, partial [Bacteroidales bacterium]|nr:glycerophosphodiester phosphodiesterase family protein [Bacteroidales bacterium]
FDYDIVKRISEIEPDAEVFYLNGDIAPAVLKSEGIKGAGYNYSVFKEKPEWIDEAKRSGVLLNVWTVNNPDDMDWFISHCFNYITTDEPELLKERIKALK